MPQKALIMLENGYYNYAEIFTNEANQTKFAEFVFNTSMTGYEEIITDPSYKGQAIIFTNPLIGNYGISQDDYQSDKIQCEAVLIRENSRIYSNFRAKTSLKDCLTQNNIIGVHNFDTRSFAKQIRTAGALKGGISTDILDPEEFLKAINLAESISDSDMYKLVINDKVQVFDGNQNSNKKIIAIDFGIKLNIIKDLQEYFNKIYLVPFNNDFEKNIANLEFDGVFLSNGPGDPRIVKNIDQYLHSFASNKIPIIGICFGHQLIGQAFGLSTFKMPFGHHGGNHPVKYLPTGKVFITAQNHNYAVSQESIDKSKEWETTWVNLFDHSVEGMKHKTLAINCVQYHPEASPGPNEANKKVFSDFYETVCQGAL